MRTYLCCMLSLLADTAKYRDELNRVVDRRVEKKKQIKREVPFLLDNFIRRWENQAYSNDDLAKAEDCYTKGLNFVSQSEKSRSCLRALMLCYSNCVATRISLGRMRETLGDCLMVVAIDPNFLKFQVRVAHDYYKMPPKRLWTVGSTNMTFGSYAPLFTLIPKYLK
ncbi:hypothetical protein L6452_22567 [Arctium lappa]|uniref:Uncharacterized protein n=1 Tax=Arctium lappa TaxID=4217 RepID=A0ACB9B050_ARCLA|nr:hypothetical protein L6452_22567 [Arctium lappa]